MLEKIIKKVAVYEYTPGGDLACMKGVQFATDHNRTDANAMRVTEWMDVEFTVLKNTEQDRLDLINKSTRKCLDEIGLIKAKLTELRKQKSELVGEVVK